MGRPSKLEWRTERRRVRDLIPAAVNPRRLTPKAEAELTESVKRFGYVELVVVDTDGTLIAGHQRAHVLTQLGRGDEEIEVRVPSRKLTEREAQEYNLRSNKNVAEWDADLLLSMDSDLLLEVGMDREFMEGFDLDASALDAFGPAEQVEPAGNPDADAEPQNDRAAELAQKWGVETGQVWRLGEHRLMCGDSRSPEHVASVMGGEAAHCCWTDPPYGVSYKGGTGLTIQGDDADGLGSLLASAFSGVDSALEPGGAIYVAHPATGSVALVFDTAFVAAGWRLHQTLIWLKDSMVLGHSDYHFKHEPITFGYKPGPGRRGRGGQGWYGDDSQTSVLEFARPKRSAEHPTMKPVELVEHCLRNSSPPRGVVYEPFSGSGTTIIACERLGRRCRAIEIDPGYVAVAIQRWVDATGGTPELVK